MQHFNNFIVIMELHYIRELKYDPVFREILPLIDTFICLF